MRQVKLADVARLAEVSISAAGKILNGGSDRIRVGAEARKRILEAARQLNYHPNMAASILAGGSSRLIGVFVDSFAHYRTLRLIQEIERLSSGQGYRIITSFSHENIADMKEDYQTFLRYGVNAFICCSHDYPDMKKEIAELFTAAKNVVFMEKPCLDGMPYVRTSRLKALTAMIADACKQGYRKFGVMHGHPSALTERTLQEEFLQAVAANGLEPDENLIFEYPKVPEDPKFRIQQALERMILPKRPDFLFIDDAVYSLTLRTQLAHHGLDIKIHGGDGNPQFDYMEISSFDPCYEKIAANLLKLLFHPETGTEIPVVEAVFKK